MDQWLARDHEMEFFRRELDSFVPDRIFDAHVHFYDLDLDPSRLSHYTLQYKHAEPLVYEKPHHNGFLPAAATEQEEALSRHAVGFYLFPIQRDVGPTPSLPKGWELS